MEHEVFTLEAIAHYFRGAATLFYIFWSVLLQKYRQRNRMMRLLHLAAVLLAICYIKDFVFLIDAWKYSEYLNDLASIIDMVYLPVIAIFFIEVAKPGAVSDRNMYLIIAFQAAFVPLYVFYPIKEVCMFAEFLAYIVSATTVVYITVFVINYRKRMFDHCSYTENIDVRWVLISCYIYFATLLLYSLSFDTTTWISETVFNIVGMLLWAIVFRMASRHRVLRMLVGRNFVLEHRNEKPKSPNMAEITRQESIPEDHSDKTVEITNNNIDDNLAIMKNKQEREAIIGERLDNVMTVRKIYLNPKLTVIDLAAEICTNKTYLSLYLNNTLHTTFYDYVNKYRIEEACGIMKEMSGENKMMIAEVATASGFNSLSSFNRYFMKMKGISPSEFIMRNDNKKLKNDNAISESDYS